METNEIFDGFEYFGSWFKKMTIVFDGASVEVDVQIDGYDERVIPINGKKVLLSFLENIENVPNIIEKKIIEYYQKRREEISYDIFNNLDYSKYKNGGILKTLKLIGITVPDQDDYSEQAISLVFDCAWDIENGVGVCIIGDEIVEVGVQGIAI